MISYNIIDITDVNITLQYTGPPRFFQGPGAKLQNEAPCFCNRNEQRGQNARGFWEQNLEALLEPCRLLLLEGSLNTSKEAINKNFDFS